MKFLHTVDILIIAAYLVTIIVIGLVLRKRAQRSKDDYLLGGKTIPWYLLGLSNASGMFDISGTIWLVTIMFVYGIKSAWIPWLWPVFNQIFLMVYLSKWLRRSNATTGAEWIGTRFGFKKGAKLSHIIVVVFALIMCLGYLAYGFIGLGKFIEIFIPWEVISEYIPFSVTPEFVPHFYGIIFTLFAVFYSLLGGMSGIVWADVVQFAIMTIAALVIGYLGYMAIGANTLVVPNGWLSPFFDWKLNMDWSSIIPEVNQKIKEDGFNLFTIFFMMMVFKGVLVSVAGPAPTYDMQKILSTKSSAEASKMSGFVSVILMPIRYLMIAGFAALALVYYEKLDLLTVSGNIDFELILPTAIKEFVPVGLLGLLLAGLIAAFMSTFAGTLNAAQAYLVNDIYLKYKNPEASPNQLKTMNYATGIIVVFISIVLGLFAKDVNSVLQWIVSVLYGSYVGANILKWHWWRFNGEGFFWGMASGLLAAAIVPELFPDVLGLYLFPILLVISIIGSIIGTYSAPPTEEAVLKTFYKNVRPWGFWAPIYEKLKLENPDFKKNSDFGRDMFNVAIGIIAQTALVIIPMYLIFRQNTPLYISMIVLIVCIVLLKKYWWNTLEEKLD
ncbi:Sodium/glucose cotransporter [Mariniflexile rhizosphaerae]|uniref:sodium:solute symporter family protein n=1 Tax=unclassified Mariniflexile TaxID=2643887 RepID=UPI000CA7EF05|nr:sodium:solute symporter family protein [Mariniflexile sp. TRM1-10]AXP79812.1 Sodium/glucose cotransporter [Mariniflexile sp. TRM1-10]PLB19001.1 MAG: Na+/glucose symporter [Flavobacteriaceae bacterium FS1-H7996/R]